VVVVTLGGACAIIKMGQWVCDRDWVCLYLCVCVIVMCETERKEGECVFICCVVCDGLCFE
jgi:hypothetical protein